MSGKIGKVRMNGEKGDIFARAINSAQKHRIRLVHGRKNNADGNCSYESVLFNLNDRDCFQEKFKKSPNFYRKIWNEEMKQKVLNGLMPYRMDNERTEEEIIAGFEQLKKPKVWDVPYFGDLLMPGIACGIRKRILVFNTSENILATGHDPISVIDPRDYSGEIDSVIPVIVTYSWNPSKVNLSSQLSVNSGQSLSLVL